MKNNIGDDITYIGGCDVIRTSTFKWSEFGGDDIELMIGKKYKIITS